mmetsp:Transcript_23813/g.38631  ORF Transcript_23813/g.38631 Transcript_23813/m.38631 type:complete len:241 (-) Transcript_23813:270-992(-)
MPESGTKANMKKAPRRQPYRAPPPRWLLSRKGLRMVSHYPSQLAHRLCLLARLKKSSLTMWMLVLPVPIAMDGVLIGQIRESVLSTQATCSHPVAAHALSLHATMILTVLSLNFSQFVPDWVVKIIVMALVTAPTTLPGAAVASGRVFVRVASILVPLPWVTMMTSIGLKCLIVSRMLGRDWGGLSNSGTVVEQLGLYLGLGTLWSLQPKPMHIFSDTINGRGTPPVLLVELLRSNSFCE